MTDISNDKLNPGSDIGPEMLAIALAPKCGFSVAWVGKCENPKPCAAHANSKCCSCSAPATHECFETMGSFVCGAHLCDECEHTIWPGGCNGPSAVGETLPEDMKGHVKKNEQRFDTWWVQEEKKKKAAMEEQRKRAEANDLAKNPPYKITRTDAGVDIILGPGVALASTASLRFICEALNAAFDAGVLHERIGR